MVKKPSHATVPLKGRELGIYSTKKAHIRCISLSQKNAMDRIFASHLDFVHTLNEFNHNIGGIILLTKIRVKIQFKFYIRTNGTLAKSYSAPEKNKHIQKKHV